MNDLTGFQRDLLFTIYQLDGSFGLDIKSQIESKYDVEINHGRLYPNLDQLIEDGLVEKGTIDERTNSYEITDKGVESLRTHIDKRREQAGDLFPPN